MSSDEINMKHIFAYDGRVIRAIDVSDFNEKLWAAMSFSRWNREALYSNIPESMIEDTLISASEKFGGRSMLVPLQHMPELLGKVVEKNLSPYALFVRRD